MKSKTLFLVCAELFLALVSGVSLRAAEPATPGIVAQQPSEGRWVKIDRGYMVSYRVTLPGSDVSFEMQPIPGGKFRCGSPATEAKRSDDEGPTFEVDVAPFWMASCEVTWAEYKQYMALQDQFKALQSAKLLTVTPQNSDWVLTAPSNLYDTSFTFQLGEHPRQPAITMSHFAARQYTKWLSGSTGQTFRLPSEIEWEYACRAGTTAAYHFGDDASQFGDYGWYFGNSKDTTHQVAQKKPNPWGLYDMHGNVSEWVLDEYVADRYRKLAPGPVAARDAVVWPTKLYPRVVRGGCWDDEVDRCRSAARRGSHDDDWRAEDPNLPKSPWWFTSQPSLGVGFRVIRTLDPPPAELRARIWDADVDEVREAAARRIDAEGRGSRGVAIPELPELLRKIKK